MRCSESLCKEQSQITVCKSPLVRPRTFANRNLQTMFREFLDKGLEKGWPESLSKEQSQITLFKSSLLRSRSRSSERTQLSGPVLRDTARLSQRYPPIARYGVFGISTWPIRCDTPSPFSGCFPLGDHAEWRCDTPPPPKKRGISAILARYPMKARQMGAIPPSAILSRGGIVRYGVYPALGR